MEYNLLHKLSGIWEGEEMIVPSKWGAGGIAKAYITAREQWSGKMLTQEYSAVRDGKSWLQAHAVFTCSAELKQYKLFWFDSFGFVPAQPAEGILENADTLSFIRVSERGMTRHIYNFKQDGKYSLQLESSFDGGASWEAVMNGEYVRVA
ncbi:MAG TPA: hypothetical protein VFT64_07800 [Rickettsiales bacterium]|nr:hypothetical protein [Rickettsiales bacterium]